VPSRYVSGNIANIRAVCNRAGVGRTRRIIPITCLLALLFVPARSAVLIHEYALRGTLADNLGGPALTSLGGEITALGYIFAANQGLSLTNSLLTPANYSLEFSLKLDSVAGTTKLVDFHNRADNTGLYQTQDRLTFIPSGAATAGGIAAATNVHVVLTRDGATNVVTVFVNGQVGFSFLDTSLEATHRNDRLYFLTNDLFMSSAGDASGGTLNYLRLFNGALTSAEVSTLFSAGPPLAIPEAPIAVLFSIGLVVTFLMSRRGRLIR
jgi:hypothetical protein